MPKLKPVRRLRRRKRHCGNCGAGGYKGCEFVCRRPDGPKWFLNSEGRKEQLLHICDLWIPQRPNYKIVGIIDSSSGKEG